VSVFVMDCTTMGAEPPTLTGPMETATEWRRGVDMDAVNSTRDGCM